MTAAAHIFRPLFRSVRFDVVVDQVAPAFRYYLPNLGSRDADQLYIIEALPVANDYSWTTLGFLTMVGQSNELLLNTHPLAAFQQPPLALLAGRGYVPRYVGPYYAKSRACYLTGVGLGAFLGFGDLPFLFTYKAAR